MAEEKIFFAVEVDSGQSVANLEKLRATMKGLDAEIKSIERSRKRGTITAQEANKQTAALNVELTKSKKAYNDANKAAAGLSKTSTNLATRLTQAGIAIAGAFALRAVLTGLREATETVEEFDEAIANLQKTTGLSQEAAIDLAEALKRIDTRTSTNDLLELASAAGRLGLEGEDIIEFTEEVDKAFVALGDSLEGSAEEIGLSLGKIAANFGLEEEFGIGEAINKIGSSMNELGANSKATEAAIQDFTNRLAGVGSQAGLTVPEVQALGALFDESGQSIEVAASTFNKLLPAIGADVEGFAKIAGVNVEEFRKIVEEDAFEALKLVAVGAKSSEKGLVGLTETLENFGIKSARSASIVGILANKTDRLTELQDIANGAFRDGTSLTDEFNIKNETLGANLDKIGNAYDDWVTSLLGGDSILSQTVGLMADFVEFLNKAQRSLEDIREEAMSSALSETLKSDLREVNDLTDSLIAKGLDANKARETAIKLTVESLEQTKESQNLWGEEVQAIDDRIAAIQASTNEDEKSIEVGEEIIKKTTKEKKVVTDLIELKRLEISARRKVSAATEEATGIKNDEIKALQEELRILLELGAARDSFHFEKLEQMEAESIALMEEVDNEDIAFDLEGAREIQRVELLAELNAQKFDLISSHLQAVQDLTNVFTSNKLRALDKEANDQLAIINQRERDELITRDEADQARRKLQEDNDKKAEVIERKAFKRNKAINLASSIINTAAAVTKALNTQPVVPVGVIAAAAAGTLGAIEIATIASQKFAKGGIIQGNSHDQGGVSIMGGRAEVEGNEIILTKGVTENPNLRAAASQLNVMGGGKKFANGGDLSSISTTFALPDSNGGDELNGLIDAIADLQVTVGVSEIEQAMNNVRVAETTASL